MSLSNPIYLFMVAPYNTSFVAINCKLAVDFFTNRTTDLYQTQSNLMLGLWSGNLVATSLVLIWHHSVVFTVYLFQFCFLFAVGRNTMCSINMKDSKI